MSHECPAPRCAVIIRNDALLMCGKDWRRVSPDLQRAVYAAYRGGKGIGTYQLREAQEAAIASLGDDPSEVTS